MLQIEWADGPGNMFYTTGIEAETRDDLTNKLEDTLSLLYNAIATHSTEVNINCDCGTGGDVWPQWEYARHLAGRTELPATLSYRKIAEHIVSDPSKGHKVQLAKFTYMKMVEV